MWQYLHSSFTWLMKAGGLRLQERLVEGPPVNAFVASDEADGIGKADAWLVRACVCACVRACFGLSVLKEVLMWNILSIGLFCKFIIMHHR